MTRSSSFSLGYSIRPSTRSSHAVTPSSGMRKRIAPSSSNAFPSATRRRALLLAALQPVELERDGPVPARPSQRRLLDLLDGLGDLPARVRVLDPQVELAALVACEQPVEERRANVPDVEEAGGRGSRRTRTGTGIGYSRAARGPLRRRDQGAVDRGSSSAPTRSSSSSRVREPGGSPSIPPTWPSSASAASTRG